MNAAVRFVEIDRLKSRLDSLRPLPEHTVRTLHEQQVLEWTYHSNAIEGNTLTLKRTSRLLMNFELMRRGFLPVIIPVENRLAYYEALDTAHTRGDYSLFIELVAGLEQATLERYLRIVQGATDISR